MIIAAAIKYNNQVYFLWPPFRHSDVFRYMVNIQNVKEDHLNSVEGFINDVFEFENRQKALNTAKAANQINIKSKPYDQLFSEDLW